MALRHGSGIRPENVKILTEKEALEYQTEKIEDWPNSSDVWPFSYGKYVLSGAAAASGMIFNSSYRQKLQLRHHAYFATSLPSAMASGIFAAAYHNEMITSDILLNKTNCPICVMTNSAWLQIGFSVIFPFIISPMANIPFAYRLATCQVPHIGDLKGNIEFFVRISKSARSKLMPITIVQGLIGAFFAYAEAVSLAKLESKMTMAEEIINAPKSHKIS